MYTLMCAVGLGAGAQLVLPFALRVNTMPGTASANCRKLREDCGVVSIWRSETVWPTSEVLTSGKLVALTVTLSSVVVCAAVDCRLSVDVEATLRVTVCSVPGPASTW